MDAELRQFVLEDYDSGNLMDTFMMIGPKNTSSFLKEIVKLPNFKVGKIYHKLFGVLRLCTFCNYSKT